MPIMLVHLTDVGSHQPIRIMKTSPEGTTVTKFQDQAIPWHKLHHCLLTEQLEEKHSGELPSDQENAVRRQTTWPLTIKE
jgi:hypothetical protein